MAADKDPPFLYLSKILCAGTEMAHLSPSLKDWFHFHILNAGITSGHCLQSYCSFKVSMSSNGQCIISCDIPSSPSSPYLNCMIHPCASLEDPSFATQMDSNDLTNLRWIYPVMDVLTAVSIRPSLPPTVWCQYSSGVRPSMYECCTNPLDLAVLSSKSNMGSVLPLSVGCILFPEQFCCPTHAAICMILTIEPLEPDLTMRPRQLSAVMAF